MKNQFKNLLFIVALFLFACDPTQENNQPRGAYSEGVLIINEGNFMSADGEISHIGTDGSVNHSVFKAINGRELGANLQNVRIYDNNTYLVDNTGKVEVVESGTLKSLATIEKITHPRDVVQIDNRAFIADWGAYDENYFTPNSQIIVVNTSTFQKLDSVNISAGPEKMMFINGKVFITSANSDKISVLDPADLSIATINVPNRPQGMVMDKNNKLWVICTSRNLVRINPSSLSIEQTISITADGLMGRLAINKEKDQLFYLTTSYNSDWSTSNQVFTLSITDTSAPTESIINANNLYGIGVSPQNELYLADNKNYQSNGTVKIYKLDGTLIKEIEAGRVPSGFVFLN